MKPIDEGEGVDLDTGTSVRRGGGSLGNVPENFYVVTVAEGDALRTRYRERTVALEDEEIRQLAEAAGYTVTDE